MKKTKFAWLTLLIATLVLEIIPYGAVCVFASDPDTRVRKLFSYFDLTPYGYANFGPFITAVLTCVLLLLAVIFLLREGNGLKTAIMIIAGIAFLISLTPILYGIEYYSVVGGCISVLLLAVCVVPFIKIKKR